MDGYCGMKSLTLIVSPSGKCNLSCDYCYNRYNLSNEILDYTVLQYLMDMVFKENDFVHFVWRGGEPLIVGIDYYKRAFQYQKMAAYRYGARYSNSIQTNGVLIDRHWISYANRAKISFGI